MTSNTLVGFQPVATTTTKILILGSFPSVASLQHQQYYAHPRNQFWKILSDLLDIPFLTLPYEARLKRVMSANIGIWDVIDQTEREGSLDSDIKNPKPNNLITFLSSMPELHTIAFNGQTAAKIGLKQLDDKKTLYRTLLLPSTSPAYTLAYEKKLAQWQQLFATR